MIEKLNMQGHQNRCKYQTDRLFYFYHNRSKEKNANGEIRNPGAALYFFDFLQKLRSKAPKSGETAMKKTLLIFNLVTILMFPVLVQAAVSPPALNVNKNGLHVVFSWTNIPDARGYLFYFAPLPYTSSQTIQEVNLGNIQHFSVTLWEGASFIVAIRAFDQNGASDFSNIESVTIPRQETGKNPLVDLLLESGIPLAQEFGNALAAAGYQNHNTTPDNWGEVAVTGGSQVCAVWTPPGWNALRMGDGFNLLYEDQTGNTTITTAGGTTYEISTCAFSEINSWWLSKIAQGGCSNPGMVWSRQFTADVAGIQIPSSVFLVTCSQNGLNLAGLFQTQIHSQGFPCTFRVDGYLLPRGDISGKVPTLSQILNSTKCLEKNQHQFTCTKPSCSRQMKQNGYQGGFCNSFDECVPVQ